MKIENNPGCSSAGKRIFQWSELDYYYYIQYKEGRRRLFASYFCTSFTLHSKYCSLNVVELIYSYFITGYKTFHVTVKNWVTKWTGWIQPPYACRSKIRYIFIPFHSIWLTNKSARSLNFLSRYIIVHLRKSVHSSTLNTIILYLNPRPQNP